jgi:Uma2 family endonuclease
MLKRLSRQVLDAYLTGPEQVRPQELVWGMVHEPPAPFFGHQAIVTRAVVLLERHVREQAAGIVCVSPIDVVLDADRALVVQPDLIFVARARASIIRNQVWGAPDLVLEVESRRTMRRDRTTKLKWYRQYGVRECWLVAPQTQTIVVVSMNGNQRTTRRRFRGDARVESAVLPAFREPAAAFFD